MAILVEERNQSRVLTEGVATPIRPANWKLEKLAPVRPAVAEKRLAVL